MAVWTKGYVVTQNRSAFFIASLVERALNQLVGSLRERLQANQGRAQDNLYSRAVEVRLNAGSEGLDFAFTHEGDPRVLTMYFNLTDKGPYGLNDSSLCLLMGCSGQNELYMTTALKALAALGPTYFVACDADDAPPVALTTQPMSYLEACKKGLEVPSKLSLDKWVKEFATGTLAAGPTVKGITLPRTEAEALGIKREEAERHLSLNYDSIAVLLDEMSKTARVHVSLTAMFTGARTLCFDDEEPYDLFSCDMRLIEALDIFNRFKGYSSYDGYFTLADEPLLVCERDGKRTTFRAGTLCAARVDGTGGIHLQSRQVLRVAGAD